MTKGKLEAVGTARELMKCANAQNFEDAFIALSTGGGVSV